MHALRHFYAGALLADLVSIKELATSGRSAEIREEELVLSMRERPERDLRAPDAPTCTFTCHPLVILLAVFGSLTEL